MRASSVVLLLCLSAGTNSVLANEESLPAGEITSSLPSLSAQSSGHVHINPPGPPVEEQTGISSPDEEDYDADDLVIAPQPQHQHQEQLQVLPPQVAEPQTPPITVTPPVAETPAADAEGMAKPPRKLKKRAAAPAPAPKAVVDKPAKVEKKAKSQQTANAQPQEPQAKKRKKKKPVKVTNGLY
jgi:hypothetical protein